MEIAGHDERNLVHQRRSCLAAFVMCILAILFVRRRSENRLRRNGLPSGTTCEQCDRKPRVSSSATVVTVFASRRACVAVKARSFLFEGKRTSILMKSNSKLRWITMCPFMFFSSASEKPRVART